MIKHTKQNIDKNIIIHIKQCLNFIESQKSDIRAKKWINNERF